MADLATGGTVLDALLEELSAQGQDGPSDDLTAYPVRGTINVRALAEAVESALGGGTSSEQEAKTPAELNATNDG